MRYLLPILFLFSWGSQAGTTLKDAFEAAKLNMETLKRSDAQINQAIARKNQARAAFLPTVSGVGNETRIDQPDMSGVNRAFVLTRQYSAALRLQQPLLRGGSLSGFQMRDEEILLSRFQKDATAINLYQLVINAYYNLQLAKVDLKNLSELLKFSQQRVKEIRSLANVGRSRRGELVQAETQQLTAEAQYRQGEMNLKEAEEQFEFLTQMKSFELTPISLLPRKLDTLSSYLDKLKMRPDIKARLQEVRVADKQIAVSKGGHYPSVDLVSNYYLDRTGVLQTSEWDVAVQVSVPIFQGGAVDAQVKESVAAKRVAELNADETVRAAKRDLVILYQNYHQMQSQLETMSNALKKAEEAYQLNLKDYRFGQVTNLEVLQTLNLFIETKRSYNNLLTLAHMTFKNIEASIGVLP
jgi:outer membrane protein TolC